MTDKPRIGWIGLGKMGIPMTLNLVKAGFPLTVYNRTASKTQELVDAGATAAADIAGVTDGADVVISMTSDDGALESVAAEALGAMQSGAIYVDMSTVSPAASARVAEAAAAKGISYVRAPVSGSVSFAVDAQLIILTSGPKDACDVCDGAFEAMGKKTVYLGDSEQARYLKLVLNMMVGTTAAMVGEALALGKAGGLDWEQTVNIISNSPLASPLVTYKAEMLKNRQFDPAFSVGQISKDFEIITRTGKEVGMDMPLTSMIQDNWLEMIEAGKSELDMFAYVTHMEEKGGLKS